MSRIKTITIDDYYSRQQADQLTSVVYNLQYTEKEFGKEIENFNLIPPDADVLFSKTLNMNISVDQESGTFRIPQRFIHFEPFEGPNDWLFAVALQESIFDIFEHKSGAITALDGYKFAYRNLFDWDLTCNYILKPGQGIMFRPWLFHSFDTGLIQIFRLKENEKL